MWTDIRTVLLFHSLVLRLHFMTGNPERACWRMEGKYNTTVLNVCMRARVGACVREKGGDGLLRRAHPVRGLVFIIVNVESIKQS